MIKIDQNSLVLLSHGTEMVHVKKILDPDLCTSTRNARLTYCF